MGTRIDQLNLHSVQLGYLKILQVGNADPNNTKVGKQIRGQASISPGMANLKPSLTGHDNSADKQLKHNFKIEDNTYPQAYTNIGTLGQDFTESVERTGSSHFLKSTVPVSKLVSIGIETQEEFSTTNIIQNNGETRQRRRVLREHCDVQSMRMDSDLVIYRTTLVRTFQVVTICRVDKSEAPGSDQFHEETGTSNGTDFPRRGDRNKSDHAKNRATAAAAGDRRRWAVGGGVRRVGEGIQLTVGPQPLWLRNHNFGLAQRIMVKRLATSPHDPLGIIDSACKNQLVVVSVQYGPFNTYIPIRSTTIGKSRVARDPIAMHTSWRSNSDIASVTSIGYPRMRASGESSTTKHRLLHASVPHPIPPPNDPKTNQYNHDLELIHSTNGNTFRVVRTNQYNHDLELIHSTNGNHLESPNEGSSIDHQVTIHLHAQNITMFPTNETWYFTSQTLVSSSGGLILILTAQSTTNKFRMYSDY
ncbi:hypothetical protein F511_40025 [Dorcoceras hygrometricum]|uniref:Uncharacterized protein n=1 Tax=Dorcoceras hygrometricum TaxID=472368 RepID=A0A2Z7BT95_9LAMI|nr:hypothetical protein F511_40025 [Dorcoceras hygrometricum]